MAARAGLVEEARHWAWPTISVRATFRPEGRSRSDGQHNGCRDRRRRSGRRGAGDSPGSRRRRSHCSSSGAKRSEWHACGVFSSPLTRRRLADLGFAPDAIARLNRPISALNLETTRGVTCRIEYTQRPRLRLRQAGARLGAPRRRSCSRREHPHGRRGSSACG